MENNFTQEKFFSLIIPTYNEAGNIEELLKILLDVLSCIDFEIIIVDDNSPDRTWEVAGNYILSRKISKSVRVIRRQAKRGLSHAVLEGFQAARGQFLGVMDADHSHDPELLPKLLEAVQHGKDLAVGSRRVKGGGADRWPWFRRWMSNGATLFSRALLGLSLKDPMSGFFVFKKEIFLRSEKYLHPRGYKILLELIVNSRLRAENVAELPYVFKDRRQGYSKMTISVVLAFFSQNFYLFLKRIFKAP